MSVSLCEEVLVRLLEGQPDGGQPKVSTTLSFFSSFHLMQYLLQHLCGIPTGYTAF